MPGENHSTSSRRDRHPSFPSYRGNRNHEKELISRAQIPHSSGREYPGDLLVRFKNPRSVDPSRLKNISQGRGSRLLATANDPKATAVDRYKPLTGQLSVDGASSQDSWRNKEMYIGEEEEKDRRLQKKYARENMSKSVGSFARTAWDIHDHEEEERRKMRMGTYDKIVALPGGWSYRYVEGARRGELIGNKIYGWRGAEE